MPQMCEICKRGPKLGNMIVRRGKAKKEGGVGKKTTGITRRSFRPNLQRIRALRDGQATRMWVCTRCIKSGKVQKPLRTWKAGV